MSRRINTAAVSENPADCVLLLRIPCSANYCARMSGTIDAWQMPIGSRPHKRHARRSPFLSDGEH